MKTAIDLYQSVLREIDKYGAPSFEVGDFVYFYNKAITQYVNQRYSLFEIKQQLTDDLRVLIVSGKEFILNPTVNTNVKFTTISDFDPEYLHLLNCIVTFKYKKLDCNGVNYLHAEACKRLDADKYAYVINNSYLKPDVKRPYFKISGDQLEIVFDTPNKLNTEVVVNKINIDYLRTPTRITLDSVTFIGNTSEFPDYVDTEIINICTKLFLENVEQGRIQTNIPINQTIN